MVTDLQFYHAVRAYAYRTRLQDSMNELEARIQAYMDERQLSKIGVYEYVIMIEEGSIAIAKRPLSHVNQISMEFYAGPNGNSGSIEKCIPPKSERI